MKLEDGREVHILIAYYQRRWVDVPLFFVPERADKGTHLAKFEFVPLDGTVIEPAPRRECPARGKIFASVRESIVPWLWSERSLKQLCKRNDIPLSWVTDRFPRKKYLTSGKTGRREERKNTPLTPKEFRKLRKELGKVSKQSRLIADILWFLNSRLAGLGGFVTLEEIVRMQIEDVDPDLGYGTGSICLFREKMNCSSMIAHFLPSRLWNPLCQQINEKKSMFVFANSDGGPLLVSKIDGHLKLAAKRAGFKEPITSLSLRPSTDKKEIEKAVKRAQDSSSSHGSFEPVSLEEWEVICKNIPSIFKRKGRRSTHQPLELLNAILHHLKTKCPIRKLLPPFPPWQAVHSQYRRWKKGSVLDQFFNFRKSKSTR